MKELSDRISEWERCLEIPGKPNEWETKTLLSSLGISVPQGILLQPGQDAKRIITDPEKAKKVSFPCTIKVCSGEIIHKTERNGVVLGIEKEELPFRVTEMRNAFPEESILVEEMVPYGGFELILGVLEDQTFGPAVMVGAGGILTELYQDVTFRLAPCTKEEAQRMISELKVSPVLSGYRNIKMDSSALAEIIHLLSIFAESFAKGERQLDINPIVWSNGRWIVLDAKAVLEDS